MKFENTGSVANKKKRNCKCTVLTEETLDEIGASLERTPTKSIPKLAQQMGISESSAHGATKLLKLKPYKCTSVHSLKQGDPVSRMHYCEWFHSTVNDGIFDPQLLFFSDDKVRLFYMLYAWSLCRRKAGCGTPNRCSPVRF